MSPHLMISKSNFFILFLVLEKWCLGVGVKTPSFIQPFEDVWSFETCPRGHCRCWCRPRRNVGPSVLPCEKTLHGLYAEMLSAGQKLCSTTRGRDHSLTCQKLGQIGQWIVNDIVHMYMEPFSLEPFRGIDPAQDLETGTVTIHMNIIEPYCTLCIACIPCGNQR